jgi:hypothetical protein
VDWSHDIMAIFMDDAPHVAGTIITIVTLAILTFGLRCYVRITRGAWGPEDWCMTVAMVCALGIALDANQGEG